MRNKLYYVYVYNKKDLVQILILGFLVGFTLSLIFFNPIFKFETKLKICKEMCKMYGYPYFVLNETTKYFVLNCYCGKMGINSIKFFRLHDIRMIE